MPNRLTAKPLVNWQNVNSFKYANQWYVSYGNSATLYFQVVDLDQCGPCGPGLRYIPGIGSSNMPDGIRVTFPSIDCTAAFTLIAQQNPNDGSIWSVTIPVTNTPQTGNVTFQLFEGNNVTSFSVLQMIVVGYPGCDGSDGILPDSTYFF